MANRLFKDETIKIDNSAGSLTDYTAYLTSFTVSGQQDTLDQTTMSLEERTYLAGQAGGSLQMAGLVNSTTVALLNPLIGNRTTATKTIQHQAGTGASSVIRGEYWLTSIEYSGSKNSLMTFSASGTLDGVQISTSVAL